MKLWKVALPTYFKIFKVTIASWDVFANELNSTQRKLQVKAKASCRSSTYHHLQDKVSFTSIQVLDRFHLPESLSHLPQYKHMTT